MYKEYVSVFHLNKILSFETCRSRCSFRICSLFFKGLEKWSYFLKQAQKPHFQITTRFINTLSQFIWLVVKTNSEGDHGYTGEVTTMRWLQLYLPTIPLWWHYSCKINLFIFIFVFIDLVLTKFIKPFDKHDLLYKFHHMNTSYLSSQPNTFSTYYNILHIIRAFKISEIKILSLIFFFL